MKWFTMLLMISLLFLHPVNAQDEIAPQRVTISAADSLTLVGDFYAADGEAAPAVLLLDWNLDDDNWSPLIPALHEAGYTVLITSMRGYGQTLGMRNWPLAETDIQLWLDWLRAQPGIDPARVSIGGGSVGANMALRGMANDPDLVTVFALAPGLRYATTTTPDAMEQIETRPVFLAVSQTDSYASHTVKQLAGLAQGDFQIRIYPDSGHATEMLFTEPELVDLIVAWLNQHNE